MAEETLKEKTAKGLFWGGISNGLQQLLSLVFGIILLRILDANDYGMVGMLAIFTGIVSTIQESGFTAALVNKKEFNPEDYNAVFWFSLLTGVVMYIILFFAAPLIAWFYDKPALINLSRLLFVGFIFGGVGIAHNAVLVKKIMVKERAKIDIIALFVSGFVGVVLALIGFSYWGLAIQSLVYILVCTSLKWYFSPWKPSFKIDFYPLKNMFSFSFKLFITNVFWQINSNIFSVLLGKFYDAKQVGFYAQGNKWMTMGSTAIAGMINGIAQPILVQMSDDPSRQCNAFRKMLRFGAFVSFPLMFGLAFVGKEFLLIAGGEKWLPSVPFLQLFCFWGAVYYIWVLYVNLLMSHGKSNIYLRGILYIGMLQLLTVIIVFPYGIFSMIIIYIISFYIGLFYWHFFANKMIGLKIIDVFKDISPYILATFVSLVLAWLITKEIKDIYLLLAMKIILSAVLYILIMWMSNSVIFKEVIAFIKRSGL